MYCPIKANLHGPYSIKHLVLGLVLSRILFHHDPPCTMAMAMEMAMAMAMAMAIPQYVYVCYICMSTYLYINPIPNTDPHIKSGILLGSCHYTDP